MGLLTTSTDIPPPVREFYARRQLKRALPYLQHGRMAVRFPLKQRQGDIIVMRRLEKLTTAPAPLNEGVPPQGKKPTKTDISQPIQQHGDFIQTTDFGKAVLAHPVLSDYAKLLGEQAGQTLDELMRDEAAAGTEVQYGGTAAARIDLLGTAHKVTTALLDRIIRALEQSDASMFTEMISATVKVSTFGIRPAYFAIISPAIKFTLEGLSGYKSVEEYGSTGPVLPGEVGAYKNLRFLMSTKAKKFPNEGGVASGDVLTTDLTNADVHTLLCFGEEGLGSIPLDGMSLQNIIKPLGSAGAADPLNQVCTTGWKSTGARKRLNELFILRGEVTVGLNAP